MRRCGIAVTAMPVSSFGRRPPPQRRVRHAQRRHPLRPIAALAKIRLLKGEESHPPGFALRARQQVDDHRASDQHPNGGPPTWPHRRSSWSRVARMVPKFVALDLRPAPRTPRRAGCSAATRSRQVGRIVRSRCHTEVVTESVNGRWRGEPAPLATPLFPGDHIFCRRICSGSSSSVRGPSLASSVFIEVSIESPSDSKPSSSDVVRARH